jgi:hypothetical protein
MSRIAERKLQRNMHPVSPTSRGILPVHAVIRLVFIAALLAATSASRAGILQEDPVDQTMIGYYTYNLESPGLKTPADLNGKRYADTSTTKNDDNEGGKGKNFWGNYALFNIEFGKTAPVDMRFTVLNADDDNQDADKLGTAKTTEYWVPITAINNTADDWTGIRLKVGFGTFVKDGDALKDQFKQIADNDNLDLDFNKTSKDDATQVLDPSGVIFGPTFVYEWSFDAKPDTFTWSDTKKKYITPGKATDLKFSFDTPNNNLIPKDYWTGDNMGYVFTIRVEPIAVPEPSSLALICLTLSISLLCRYPRRRPMRSGPAQ